MPDADSLTTEERVFCRYYAANDDVLLAFVMAFADAPGIPERHLAPLAGVLLGRQEIRLEIYVQRRLLESINRDTAILLAEYEEARQKALRAGNAMLAASITGAKAILLGRVPTIQLAPPSLPGWTFESDGEEVEPASERVTIH